MTIKTRLKIYTTLLIVIGISLYAFVHKLEQRTRGPHRPAKAGAPAVLPQADKEMVTFNEKTHTLTVQTAKGIIKEYAKNPIVEIKKDGDVSVTRHLVGLENDLFIGGGYADSGRIILGDNVLHLARIDVFGAVSWSPDNRHTAFKIFGGIGYNFYHDCSINVGIDPVSVVTGKPIVGGFLTVRL